MLTAVAPVPVRVGDRFTARIIELHFQELVLTLDDPIHDGLRAFAGIELDGYPLLNDPAELSRYITREDTDDA